MKQSVSVTIQALYPERAMKPIHKRASFWLPAALVVLASITRVYGLDWGLPQIYEEATPLNKAWKMWGFGEQYGFDLNPHFFNYPSLTIYLQFFGIGVLFLILKISGVVASLLDFRVMWILDPTPFVLFGRIITVCFSVATVFAVYRLCRRAIGLPAAVAAGFLLAIHPYHIEKSQVIEVDVPLTFFTVLALSIMLGLRVAPNLRNYLLAGLAIGLAMSTKYTGALLLLPFLTAHLFAMRGSDEVDDTATWKKLSMGAAAAGVVFVLTSPYVLLDFGAFRADMRLEQEHMRLGHFGLDTSPAWWFYMRSLFTNLLGAPLALLALASAVYLGVMKRQPWALILLAFAVPYFAAIGSWAMKADRYALPLVPVAIILSGALIAEIARAPRLLKLPSSARYAMVSIVVLLAAIPLFLRYPHHLDRLRPDTRTEARKWIETNVRPGAFVATEYHGPRLLGPDAIWTQEVDVRERLLAEDTPARFYAVQPVPMFQVEPERSDIFYSLRLYEVADFIVTSSAVKSRYEREPERFQHQLAFYDTLEATFIRAKEFTSEDMTGPVVTVYRNPAKATIFADRQFVLSPKELPDFRDNLTGEEGQFYYNLALNYETFGHHQPAIEAYTFALQYPSDDDNLFFAICLGLTRSLVSVGQDQMAAQFLDQAIPSAPSRRVAAQLVDLRRALGPTRR